MHNQTIIYHKTINSNQIASNNNKRFNINNKPYNNNQTINPLLNHTLNSSTH